MEIGERRLKRMKKWTRRVSLNILLTKCTVPTHCFKAAAKHAEFLKARGRHYSNEAEAMKVSLFIRNQF